MNGITTHDKHPPEEIIKLCTDCLETYYEDDIAVAVRDNRDSITIEYNDIYNTEPGLADDLLNSPRIILQAFRTALTEFSVPVANAESVLDDMDVRVSGVKVRQPIVSELRDEPHRGNYIGLRGQVSLATQVKPKLMDAMFKCKRCSSGDELLIGPIPQQGNGLDFPQECPSCERQGPFELDQNQSRYLDHQIIELTDPPGENPGETGNVVPCHLYGELAGKVKPGDRVRINGIAQTPQIQINSGNQKVDRRQDWEVLGHAIDEEETAFEEVEPERVDEIETIPEDYNVKEAFIDSFAPGILTGERGDKHKLAILLALFGGYSQSDRDDINVFLIGAPGTGKSAYLERANELAPKSVQASGKGATAAGLTATATKSETTGKWMLDAGALVLASGGVACIDEFDKMADSVRQSMHEAMENQQVPINKAGINTTLTTETTVLAAANPSGGSFDRFQPPNEQVEIDSPLLSRFDLIFGVKDPIDEDRDAMIARHQHTRIDEQSNQTLDDELITEYIAYARQNIQPRYESEEPKEKLVDYYTELRQKNKEDSDSLQPITARVNDALRRLAQASARMHLREEITLEDSETAIELMDMSIGDTAFNEKGEFDPGQMEGRNLTQDDRVDLITSAIEREKKTAEEIADETGVKISMVEKTIENLKQKGAVYEPEGGHYLST